MNASSGTRAATAAAKPELRLLTLCARLFTSVEEEAEIRQIMNGDINWTLFAQAAVERRLVSLAGHTLIRVALDKLPNDVGDAFREIVAQSHAKNRALLDELSRVTEVSSSERSAFAVERVRADRALAVNPHDAAAWRNLGKAFFNGGRHQEAVACYDRALELSPDDVGVCKDGAQAMAVMGRRKAALTYLDKAVSIDPQDADAWSKRAQILSNSKRFTEAVEACDRALALDPANLHAARVRIHALLFSCDWRKREEVERCVRDGIKANLPIITPFNHLAISNSEAENLALARIWARRVTPSAKPLWGGERYCHDKIRVAYISTDFRDTLSVNAIAGCFEQHDKARFETTALSLSPDDGSHTRRRIEAAFDRFVDIRAKNDPEVAAMVRELEIDIAIDLNGYAAGNRSGILAYRPAPVQVNYLGFAGTTGMPFIDYIIADRIVIPDENRNYYTEQVVYLPNTFFPTDRHRRIAERTPSRTEAGLPETGFVFACHNTSYKIGPQTFYAWMRLLQKIEGSVLWLSSTIPSATAILRREAGALGVAPERLIFAPRVSERADHLARLRLADLFLDTLPYNAHTTACDALWAGLPVLTCAGNTFPARVAASLLHATGLSELVTTSLREYEELAFALAQHPGWLATLKSKILRNRDTAPLFDTALFTRHLEGALNAMWERQQAGLPPVNLAIAS